MPVRGEDELDVQPLARSVELALLQTVIRRKMLGFRFDQSERHRLRVRIDPNAQDVVGPSSPPRRARADQFNRPGGLLTADEILSPAPSVQGGIEQLRAGVGFGEHWEGPILPYSSKAAVRSAPG